MSPTRHADPLAALMERVLSFFLGARAPDKPNGLALRNLAEALLRTQYFSRCQLSTQAEVRVTGEHEGREISVHVEANRPRTTIEVRAKDAIPELTIVQGPAKGGRIETGDPFFDQRFNVGGNVVQALATLDTEIRERILSVPHLEVQDRTVRIRVPDARRDWRGVVGLTEVILSVVDLFAARSKESPEGLLLARAWREPGSRARIAAVGAFLEHFGENRRASEARRVLVDIIASDPNEEARDSALQALLATGADSVEARLALEKATRDASARIRHMAARHLGPEGVETLRGLSESRFVPDNIRRVAVRELVASVGAETAAPTLVICVREAIGDVREYALAQLVSNTDQDKVGVRLAAAQKGIEPEGAHLILDHLNGARFRGIEDVLLGLLSHDDVAVKTRAALGLGVVGTLRAVGALMPYSKGILADVGLKETARNAIRNIQSRAPGGDAGGLSLAELGEVGLLSEPEVDPGGLSFVADDAPTLPSSPGSSSDPPTET